MAAPDEEELDVVMEFPEFEDTNLITTAKNYSLIGLDSDHPILKLDDLLFQGTWEESVGTVLLFKENPQAASPDARFPYTSKTAKKLRFMKIRVEKREEASAQAPQVTAPANQNPA